MESIFFPFAQNSADVGVIGGASGPTAIFTTSSSSSPLTTVILVAVIAVVGFVLWKKFGHR